MASVVLNQRTGSDQLYAGGALLGGRGLVTNGAVEADSALFFNALTVSDKSPQGAATTVPSRFTNFAADQSGGGLQPNALQKYAYCDPKVAPQTIQQYELGYWSATATTTVPPNQSPDAIFVNRPSVNGRPFVEGALIGTFTTTALALVVSCPNITASARVRLSLVGGSIAAFAAGIAGAPAITIQVGATTAASTFTVAGTTAGFVYAYEVLLA
jgi:hypothetical protein